MNPNSQTLIPKSPLFREPTMNPNSQTSPSSIPHPYLQTRFALRFLRALRKMRSPSPYRIKLAAYASMASAVGSRRAWSRATLLKLQWRMKKKRVRRMSLSREGKLRKLVPGGEGMDMAELLEETADYIKCLATQVMVMRRIVTSCST